MKGLKEYIEKHGVHFTVELAEEAISYLKNKNGSDHRWSAPQIEALLKNKVYYNITNASIGDMVYVANLAYSNLFPKVLGNSNKCIDYTLSVVEDIDGYEGIPFSTWIAGLRFREESFDFTPYI